MPNIISVGPMIDESPEHTIQTHMAIQSPNGEMHICRINDEENSKLRCINQEMIREEDQPIFLHCGVTYYLTPDELSKKHLLYRYTVIVHVICSIDIIFYILLIIISNYFLYGPFMLIISLIGLDATISYSKCNTRIYLGYQYIQTIYKFYIVCGLFVNFTIQKVPHILIENNGKFIKETPALIIVIIVFAFYQLYVTYNVHRLYQLLPSRRIIQY
jgi:hypothetical protein